MILGVISDTHGNHALMRKAAQLLKNRLLATHIIHLGDDYDDMVALEQEGFVVSGVPGLWCGAYRNAKIPKARIEEFERLRVAFAHAASDLPPLTSDIGLALVGHTHRYSIVQHQGVPAMNPGHLKNELDRMRPPTFGIARITPMILYLSVHSLDGRVILEEEFPRKTSSG